jgi:hypothetical protein
MFVIRPRSILGTPRQLAQDLGWRTRVYPHPRRPDRTYSYLRDFMMTAVSPQHLRNAPPDYTYVHAFAFANKLSQRRYLSANVPAPTAAGNHAEASALTGDKFVVRPLRHSGGRGYRVTENRLDFTPGEEYISELYRKRREYRVIFVFGKPLVYLRKKPNEGVSDEAPWGYVNSRFQTINDVPGSRLAATDCVSRLSALPVVQFAHIVAADILYNGSAAPGYSVLELNFAPALDIDGNRAKVVEEIKRFRPH